MSLLQAFVLGLLQGVTEFMPVSSSGHLVLVPWLLGWPVPGLVYDTVVHLGTLVAVLLFFRQDVLALVRAWWESVLRRRITTPEARLAWLLIVGTLPAALLGYFLEDSFADLFGSPRAVSLLLWVTGGVLLVSERAARRKLGLGDLNLGRALGIGVAQGLAIAPGLSRSGATMAAGVFCGLSREAAARFSFLLMIPIVAGAASLQLVKAAQGSMLSDIASLGAGFLAAALGGYGTIRFLLRYLRARSFLPFSFYCFFIGLLGFIVSWIR